MAATATPKIYISSITEYHRLAGLPAPSNTLLSVVKFEELDWKPIETATTVVRDFYIVAFKKKVNTTFKYGQQDLSIDGGVLHFMAPKQILTIDAPASEITNSGWQLLIHPDFIWNKSLAKKIRQYEFFGYQFNQVVPLSSGEEETVAEIFKHMEREQHLNASKNTQDILLAHIELLLAYAERFYRERQTGIAENQGHDILVQLDTLMDDYLQSADLVLKGIPSIKYISAELNISPNYLTRLIHNATGQSTQYFVHNKLIALAKEKLSTTAFSVSEIAYQLGFKSPQSFSRLFMAKTAQTPTAFRQSF